MSDQKQIKFQFMIDDPSYRKALNAFQELTKEAEKFSAAMKGSSGASKGGAGASNKNAASEQNKSFADIVSANAKALKEMGKVGSDAMKTIAQSVDKSIKDQRENIKELRKELSFLQDAYKKAGPMGKDQYSKQIASKIGEVYSAEQALSRFETGAGRGQVAGQGFMGGAFGGGMLGGFAGSLLADIVPKLKNVLVGGVSAVMRDLGGDINAMNRFGSINAGLYGGHASGIAGKDYSSIIAMSAIAGDPQKRRALQASMGLGGKTLYEHAAEKGLSTGAMDAAGETVREYELFKAASSKAFDEKGFSGAWTVWRDNSMFVDNLKNNEFYRQVQSEKANAAIEAEKQMDPIGKMARAQFLEDPMGKMGLMRAIGMGARQNRGTNFYESSYRGFLNKNYMYSDAEQAGALQSMFAGGRSGSHGGLRNVLEAIAGGITGAGNISGAFRAQGGGAAGNLISGLRARAGAGADVSAMNVVGQYLAEMLSKLNLGFRGLGALDVLSSGMTGGRNSSDVMIAKQNIAGMNQLQNILSGNVDPYQQARNFQIASGVVGNKGFYAARSLSKNMNIGQIADILGGNGDLDAIDKASGITLDDKRKVAMGMLGTISERFINDPNASPVVQRIAKGLRGGMTPMELKKSLAAEGFSNEDMTGGLGALLEGAFDLDRAGAIGTARVMLNLGGKSKRGKKKIGDVAGGSAESQIAQQEMTVREGLRNKGDADWFGDAGILNNEVKNIPLAFAQFAAATTNYQLTADALYKAALELQKAAGVQNKGGKGGPQK